MKIVEKSPEIPSVISKKINHWHVIYRKLCSHDEKYSWSCTTLTSNDNRNEFSELDAMFMFGNKMKLSVFVMEKVFMSWREFLHQRYML